MEVKIDLRKSLIENAQTYYEKAKKAKEKIPGLIQALEQTKKEIKKVGEKTIKRETLGRMPEKRMWFEKFRWFTSSDGFLVVGGKDATSNEVLIKKHTEPNDLVFHADVFGAPFFVVKNPGKKSVPDATLGEAATASASYSSGWKNGLGAVDVYYVSPEQVSKTPESGEYLAKGAFVVRGRREWFRKTALSLGVGLNVSERRVFGGPLSAVKRSCDFFVGIMPGDKKQGDIAGDIKKLLERRSALDVDIPLSYVQKFIPSGKSRVIK